MHSVQSNAARFSTLTTSTSATHHPNIVVVEYRTNSWHAVDNDDSLSVAFTPLASDLIIASIGSTKV